MAASKGVSKKHLLVDKANTTVVILVSVAAFIATFTLVASKALLAQRAYQGKIIKEKTTARDQLDANIRAAGPLAESYKTFVGKKVNVIGGVPEGIGNNDGDNAKIVLDALPSKYDFPAVVSSLEKLLPTTNKPYKLLLENIKGTDDEINQQATTANGLVEIPFEATIVGDYAGAKQAITFFERSIRPFQIDSITITGGDADMNMKIVAKTYYQPEKSLKLTTKDVK